MKMKTSGKMLWVVGVALCCALGACGDKEQSAEQVAMGQFKTACKGGNLQACNAILAHEQQNGAAAAQGTTMMGVSRY